MLKRLPTMPGAERRTPARLSGGMGDSEGGAGEGLAGSGKGFGAGFGGGGSDGPDFGGESEGGAGGMGSNVAEILQTISANLEKLLDLAAARGLTPEGANAGGGIPGASDAMQSAQKIVDALESGKTAIGSIDTSVQWARSLGPLIEGVMAAGAPAGF